MESGCHKLKSLSLKALKNSFGTSRHPKQPLNPMNRRTLKRIVIVLLFVAVLLFLGYLESDFLPNH